MSGLLQINVPPTIRIDTDTASPMPRWYRRPYRYGIELLFGLLMLAISVVLYMAQLPSRLHAGLFGLIWPVGMFLVPRVSAVVFRAVFRHDLSGGAPIDRLAQSSPGVRAIFREHPLDLVEVMRQANRLRERRYRRLGRIEHAARDSPGFFFLLPPVMVGLAILWNNGYPRATIGILGVGLTLALADSLYAARSYWVRVVGDKVIIFDRRKGQEEFTFVAAEVQFNILTLYKTPRHQSAERHVHLRRLSEPASLVAACFAAVGAIPESNDAR